jgi:mycofactocin system glycosyltransferase
VTVVVPVRDRTELLDGCLAGAGRRYPVVVVDDGSRDAGAVATVAGRHGASVIRLEVNGGPGAARNAAVRVARTELIAFVDSDCVPAPGWIEGLAGHFADPLVGAVAPRIAALAADSWAGRYAAASGCLDMGDRAARVTPGTWVSHVPTAALLARRAALLDVARGGDVFDPALRTGEDVDLVWRLDRAGWRVRYDPAVQVRHREPGTWAGLLARRFRYGTSAAPLALRHPGALPPLVLHPAPALTVAALLMRRPGVAAASFGSAVLIMNRTLRRARVPTRGTARAMLAGVGQTWLGAGRYGMRFGAPLLALAIAAPGGRTPGQRWGRRIAAGTLLAGPPVTAWAKRQPKLATGRHGGRRIAAGTLLAGPPVTAWAKRRPELDPVRFVLGNLADDIAYGSGVLAGCAAHRTSRPLRPLVVWRPLRRTIETEVRHGR